MTHPGHLLPALALLWAAAAAQEIPVIEPGPEHEVLHASVGTWAVAQTMWPGPEAEPVRGEGTMVTRLVAGGLAIAYEYSSPASEHGPAFHGYGVTAWIPAKKHFEAWWFDNLSRAGMARSTGTWDPKTKTLTEAMSGPGPDGKASEFKVVTVMESDHRHVQTFYVVKDGKEIGKMMELVFTRPPPPPVPSEPPAAPAP